MIPGETVRHRAACLEFYRQIRFVSDFFDGVAVSGSSVRIALNKHVIDNHCQIIGPIYKIIYPDNTVEIKLPIARLASFDMNYSEDISVPTDRYDSFPIFSMV